MKTIKAFALAALLCSAAFAQNIVTTTLAGDVVDSVTLQINVADLTKVNVGDMLYVDREAMLVLRKDVAVTVARGQRTQSATHQSGATVYAGKPDKFYTNDPASASLCTSANVAVTPWINITNGNQWTCSGGKWTQTGGGGGGAVASVFGRTGAVVAASGDYTAAQVTNAVDQTGSYSNPGWITALAAAKLTGHNCASNSDAGYFCSGTDAANLTGTINNARLPTSISITGPLTATGPGGGVAGALDLGCGTTPSNPSSGTLSYFCDGGNSNHLSSVNSSGSVVDLQAGGASGALVLIEKHTASSSGTIDFTSCISSTYDDYLITATGVQAATDGTSLRMRTGTGVGPTWDTGSTYDWTRGYCSVGTSGCGSSGSVGAANDSAATLAVLISSSHSTEISSLRFSKPADTTSYHMFNVIGIQHASDSGMYSTYGAAGNTNTTAVTGVRLFMAAGNIATGDFRCYGITK